MTSATSAVPAAALDVPAGVVASKPNLASESVSSFDAASSTADAIAVSSETAVGAAVQSGFGVLAAMAAFVAQSEDQAMISLLSNVSCIDAAFAASFAFIKTAAVDASRSDAAVAADDQIASLSRLAWLDDAGAAHDLAAGQSISLAIYSGSAGAIDFAAGSLAGSGVMLDQASASDLAWHLRLAAAGGFDYVLASDGAPAVIDAKAAAVEAAASNDNGNWYLTLDVESLAALCASDASMVLSETPGARVFLIDRFAGSRISRVSGRGRVWVVPAGPRS